MIAGIIPIAVTMCGIILFGLNKLSKCSNYWIGLSGILLTGIGLGSSIEIYLMQGAAGFL
jgi:hypothetical protein